MLHPAEPIHPDSEAREIVSKVAETEGEHNRLIRWVADLIADRNRWSPLGEARRR